jgi:hypothetical protein
MTDASALLAAIDASGPPADFRIHTAAFGTLLATLTLHDPSFVLVEPTLILVKRPAIEAVVVANGDAAVWEIRNGAGTQILTGTIGQGTGQIRIDRTALLSGGPLGLAALSLLVTGPGVATASGRIALGRASATGDFAPPLATGALRYQGDVLADAGTNLLRFNPTAIASFGGTGATGPRGFEGERGEQGERGDQGFPGTPGAAGQTGPTGPMGPGGADGADGSDGVQGIPGATGATGATGSIGPQGPVQGLAVCAITEDPAEEPGEFIPLGWGNSLRSNPRSGGASAFVDVGDIINFGLDGVGPGQIRSGDANFTIRGTNQMQLSGNSSVIVSSSTGSVLLSATTALTLRTASTDRVIMAGTGEWTTPAGSSGQVWTHQGAGAPPTWATPSGSSAERDSLLPLLTQTQGNEEPESFIPAPGWAAALRSNPRTGGANAFWDVGDFANFGLAGPTTGQIRSGDAQFRIHGSAALQLIGDTSSLLSGGSGAQSVAVDTALTLTTGSSPRVVMAGSGEWTTPAGSSGQVWTHAGAGNPPAWATPAAGSSARDALLPLLTTTQDNQEPGEFIPRPAFGGDVVLPAGGSQTTIANDAVTNTKLANMAQATIKLRASGAGTGDPIDGTISQALDMASATNGAVLARTAGSWATAPNQANGRHMITDGGGAATWANVSSTSVSLDTTGALAVIADNDRDISVTPAAGVQDGVAFVRSMARGIFWEDFCVCAPTTLTTGTVFSLACDTGWLADATGSNGTVQCRDNGASGASTTIGELEVITGASDNSFVRLFKGAAITTRWLGAQEIQSFKCRATLASAASVGFVIGFADSPYGGGDAAYFYFDTDLDTTIHAFSANSGGATSTDTDSNIAPGTTTHDFEIRCPLNTTQWEYLIDGVVVATHTTTAKNRGMNLNLLVMTRTTAAKTIYWDHCSLETKPIR